MTLQTSSQDLLHAPERAAKLLKAALETQRLDLAALSVAALEYPELNETEYLEQLDGFAQRVRELLPPQPTLLQQIQALKRVLADEEGFRGNSTKYHAPENSFLNRVLERKVGLPIALAVLYLEVARRAGIKLFGVNFPGHFLIAGESSAGKLVVDPFHGGTVLTPDGCADLLKEMAPAMKFQAEMITPAALQTIVSRMLNNLKRVYLETNDNERALRAVSLLLVIQPKSPADLRVRAHVLCALGAFKAALKDVERCLEISPDAPDKEGLEMARKALREKVDTLN